MRIMIITIVLSTLTACNSRWDDTHLHGNWEVDRWVVVANDRTINQKMDFNFGSDHKYVVDYGPQKEVGTWYMAGEYLHTKESGSIDKSVRIITLSPDSLQFEMNRAGSLERVTLLRPQ